MTKYDNNCSQWHSNILPENISLICAYSDSERLGDIVVDYIKSKELDGLVAKLNSEIITNELNYIYSQLNMLGVVDINSEDFSVCTSKITIPDIIYI